MAARTSCDALELPHAPQAIATALLAGLMLIGAGAARAQAPAQNPAAAESNDLRVDRFRQQLDADRERLKIPGLSAVILENGDVLWTEGFGYADVERRVPATPDTLYHIASITKTPRRCHRAEKGGHLRLVGAAAALLGGTPCRVSTYALAEPSHPFSKASHP
jgi:hypothetical protein